MFGKQGLSCNAVSKLMALSIILVICGCSREKKQLSLLREIRLGVKLYLIDHRLEKGDSYPSLNELEDYISSDTYRLFSESRICAYVYAEEEIQRIFPGLVAIDCSERPARAIFFEGSTETGDMFLQKLLNRHHVKSGDETFKVFPDPSGQEYFPKDKASYYTRYLSAMKEPSVKAPLKKGVERVIRFTYLRSFHDPLAVRIVDRGGALTATSIRLKMDREYRPVKILHDKTWTLNAGSSKSIRSLLAQKDFWKPLNADEEALASGGSDGSRWIFEIHDKDGYRMLDIWTPDALAMPDKELEEAGLDPRKLRDFLIYKKTGNRILEIGKILPKPEDRY